MKNTAEPVRKVPWAVANSSDCIASRRDSGVGGTSRRSDGPRRGMCLWDQLAGSRTTVLRQLLARLCRPYRDVMRAFSQVDVFSTEPLKGNPVAVVHEADGLSDAEMQQFAHWTNLSETTFLLAPTDPAADYRLRIFTPGGELPFAGHPTLGSAHAWLEAGGVPGGDDVVQECGAGLVRIRRAGRLAFAAPPLTRSGPVHDADLDAIATALRLDRSDLLDSAWIDNGPGWVGVLLRDAAAVLAVE